MTVLTRVEPKCEYFGRCGGCTYQDRSYEEQLEIKHGLVRAQLDTFQSKHAFNVQPTLPSEKPYHYRHMISLTVKRRHGKLKLGFIGWEDVPEKNFKKRFFLPIESCPIAHEKLNQFLPEALARLDALPDNRKYRTSQMVLRVGDDGEVVTSLRSDRGRTLSCEVQGKLFSYTVSSFFQHNYATLGKLVETIRTLLAPSGSEMLADLYSGVGLFSLSLAGEYRQVYGIEEGYEAVRHAKKNAERNGISNATFLEGKVEDKLTGDLSGNSALHVLVDPPRMGMKPEVIQFLKTISIQKLVYISCHLEALERDLALLESHFTVKAVQPIDLFPQTKHIETLVLLGPI